MGERGGGRCYPRALAVWEAVHDFGSPPSPEAQRVPMFIPACLAMQIPQSPTTGGASGRLDLRGSLGGGQFRRFRVAEDNSACDTRRRLEISRDLGTKSDTFQTTLASCRPAVSLCVTACLECGDASVGQPVPCPPGHYRGDASNSASLGAQHMQIDGEHGDLARPPPRMPFAVCAILDAPRAGPPRRVITPSRRPRRTRLTRPRRTLHTTLLHKVAVALTHPACITPDVHHFPTMTT